MSNTFDDLIFAIKKDAFTNIWKKIEPYSRRKLTKNESLRISYRTELTRTFNDSVAYLRLAYRRTSDPVEKYQLIEKTKYFREKAIKSFELLHLKYTLASDAFSFINLNELIEDLDASTVDSNSESESDEAPNGDEANPNLSKPSSIISIDSSLSDDLGAKASNIEAHQANTKTNPLINDNSLDNSTKAVETNPTAEGAEAIAETTANNTELNQNADQFNDKSDSNVNEGTHSENGDLPIIPLEETVRKMAITQLEFSQLAAAQINYKYSGDPTKLDAFLADVAYVEALAGEDHSEICRRFIRTRIEGKAAEALPTVIDSIKDITDALKDHVKPESSRVIEGRIAALRVVKGNMIKFSEQAEKLAESFRRSLVFEGQTKAQAKDAAVRKTIELCRKTARDSIVKSVIASHQYQSPAEVIAKLITETSIAKDEKKEAEQNRTKFDKNKQKWRGQKQNNDQRGDGQYNQKKFNKNFQRNGNKKYQNNRFRQNNGQNRQNEHTIRLISGPQPGTSSQDQPQSSQGNETFFRYPPLTQ